MSSKTLFLAPHNDDEALFAAYTLMRKKPLVFIITDAHIQTNRGEKGCDAETRWNESKKAMEILGCPVIRLGIKDYELVLANLINFFQFTLSGFDEIYAPAMQNGNPHHDIVSEAAKYVWGDKVKYYSTYAFGEFFTKGNIEVIPTEEEYQLKLKALDCYQSQINLPSTAEHFKAAKDAKSEWLM